MSGCFVPIDTNQPGLGNEKPRQLVIQQSQGIIRFFDIDRILFEIHGSNRATTSVDGSNSVDGYGPRHVEPQGPLFVKTSTAGTGELEATYKKEFKGSSPSVKSSRSYVAEDTVVL